MAYDRETFERNFEERNIPASNLNPAPDDSYYKSMNFKESLKRDFQKSSIREEMDKKREQMKEEREALREELQDKWVETLQREQDISVKFHALEIQYQEGVAALRNEFEKDIPLHMREYRMRSGKHAGRRLLDIVRQDTGFAMWCLNELRSDEFDNNLKKEIVIEGMKCYHPHYVFKTTRIHDLQRAGMVEVPNPFKT